MYNWLRDGLIPGADAILESLWLFAWISFMLAAGESTHAIRYPYAWILAMLLLPALCGRWLDRAGRGPNWLRRHGLSVLVAVLFVGFMIPFHAAGAAWLAAAALLARGVWLALSEVSSDTGVAWFLAGFGSFLALLAIGLMAHPVSWDPDRPILGPLLAVYLFAGLSWLALVRRQEMEERAFRHPPKELNATWLMLLAAISAGMIGLVALVSFGGGSVLRGLILVIAFVASLVWRAALFIVVHWLGPAVVWLFAHLPSGAGGGRLGSLFRGRAPTNNIDARLLAWLRAHLPIEVVLAIVGAMLMGLLAIYLATRFIARDPGAEDEERKSLWSWLGFLAQLRQALRGMRRAARPRPASAAQAAPPEPQLSSVRQLYAAVLRWCRDEQFHPRAPAQTPIEFEPGLTECVDPALARDLTSAYLTVRYGETEVGDGEVSDLRSRWQERLTQPL